MSIGSMFPAFKERMTRRYLIGQTASILGLWTQNITLNLLLWHMTHSPWLLGVLNFLLYCPSLVIPLIFGSRLTPWIVKKVMAVILTLSMTVSILLLAGVIFHFMTAGILLSLALVSGCISAMELPTRQLLLTSSLKDKSLTYNAVAMNTMVFNLGRMCGPAIAAWSFGFYGPAGGFVLSLAGLTVMAFAIWRIEIENKDAAARRAAGIINSLRYVKHDPFAMRFLPALVFMGIFAGSYQSLIPVLSAQAFHDTTRFTGMFYSCAGIGSLLAALFISIQGGKPGMIKLLALAPWIAVLALICISLSVMPVVTCLCFLMLGASLTFCATMTNSTLQHRSPPELRGGMVGLYVMAFQGSMPIGNLLVSAMASFGRINLTFFAMSVMLSVVLLGQLWLMKKSERTLSAE